MNIADLLETRPDELARRQEEALQDFVICRLREVADLIKKREYEKVSDLTENSPAGDGMGCDNEFISFDWGVKDQPRDGIDISVVCDKLLSLKGVGDDE